MRRDSMKSQYAALTLFLVLESAPSWAIRPFITDDARVVGKHLVQLETWVQLEDGVLQNGDAYTGIDALALQGGFRYILNDHIQLDTTVGAGVAAQHRPPWFTFGVRLVTWELW